LRLNTVTGAEVAEGKLGKVPKANLAYHLPKLVWHKLTLVNDWENANSNLRAPAWAVDAQGIVHLRGGMDETAAISGKFTTVPVAIRPTVSVWMATSLLGGQPGSIAIDPLGRAYAFDPTLGGNERSFTSLDGVTYALP
jgi:hypothetical protein